MIRLRLRDAVAAALAVAALAPSAASASSQTITDSSGDAGARTSGGGSNDITDAGFDTDGADLTFRFAVPYSTWTGNYNDKVFAYLDTNADGKGDFSIEAFGSSPSSMTLRATPDSTPTCQQTGSTVVKSGNAPVVQDGTRARVAWTVPLSSIGNVTSFRWAVYAMTWDAFNNAFDYLPDAANTDPARPNPVTTVNDSCSTPGGAGTPLVLANGIGFPGAGGGGGGGGGGTPDPSPQPADPQPSPEPQSSPRSIASAVQFALAARKAAMPKLVGLGVDNARIAAMQKLGPFVDFDIVEKTPKRAPRGVGPGDVMTQSPKPGTQLSSDAGRPARVKLAVMTARQAAGCGKAEAESAEGLSLTDALALLRKSGCTVKGWDFSFGSWSPDAVVTDARKSLGKTVNLDVVMSSDPQRHGLYLVVREYATDLSLAALDDPAGPGVLTASRLQRNYLTIQVVDRAGRLVPRANIAVDASGAGGRKDVVRQSTDQNGEATTSVLVPSAGTVKIMTWVVGDNEEPIYGAHAFRVISRGSKAGTQFTTSTGRIMRLGADGRWSKAGNAARSVRARASLFGFDVVAQWLADLAGIFRPAVIQTATDRSLTPAQRVSAIADQQRLSPGILATGKDPVGTAGTLDKVAVTAGPVQVLDPRNGKVIGNGTGNLVGQAGTNMNVVVASGPGAICAGGANVIGQAGSNLVGQAGTNFIGNASGNFNGRPSGITISTLGGSSGGSGYLLSGSGPTLVPTPGSGGMIALGNRLISDKGAGVIMRDVGGSLISDNGLG